MICTLSTKTTGLKEAHEVIELSIKPLNLPEVTWRIRPERPEFYEQIAQDMNGLSKEVCGTFPGKGEALLGIFEQFDGITPIVHTMFDLKMLRQTFGEDFVKRLITARPIDTALMTEKYNEMCLENGKLRRFKSAALKKLCVDLGIQFTTKCETIEKVYFKLKELIDAGFENTSDKELPE